MRQCVLHPQNVHTVIVGLAGDEFVLARFEQFGDAHLAIDAGDNVLVVEESHKLRVNI